MLLASSRVLFIHYLPPDQNAGGSRFLSDSCCQPNVEDHFDEYKIKIAYFKVLS